MKHLTTEKIEVLVETRKLIKNKSYSFLCFFAIGAIEKREPRLTVACISLLAAIHQGLDSNESLEAWQWVTGYSLKLAHLGTARKARLAWIDWMIACLKKDNP